MEGKEEWKWKCVGNGGTGGSANHCSTPNERTKEETIPASTASNKHARSLTVVSHGREQDARGLEQALVKASVAARLQ